jgi:hypothetical protein
MKGVVFNTLGEMVEEKLGIEVWDQALLTADPASGGSYTAAGSYDDEELLQIVTTLSEMSGVAVPQLIHDFGVFLLGAFARRYPQFFVDVTVRQFLLNVDGIIHDEVRKLYPDAGVPSFDYEEPAPDQLIMLYRSPRKMCTLAEGLIRGAGGHFGVEIGIEHPTCLHRGDDHCRLELRFGGPS